MTLFPGESTTTGPELAPFQSEAVAVILQMLARRGGALLADGAGLGKSWIAAAVARAWEDRGGTSEIVVPASLVGQWRGVAELFGLASSITSHDACSVRPWRATRAEPLVIVDEAHRFRNPRTRRYRSLGSRIRAAAVLLVTATPICNLPDDLRALLGLVVADDALADRGIPSLDEAFRERDDAQLRAALDELAISREREVLPSSLLFVTASRRTIRYRAAGRHADELGAAFGRLRFPLVAPVAAGMLRSFLWRRLESSATALRATLARLRKLHARALDCATRGVALNRASYRAAFGDPDAPLFQDILFPELWGAGTKEVLLDAAEIRRELEELEEAVRLVGERFAVDPKVAIVSKVVAGLRGKRGLVFTQSRDTARALWSALRTKTRCGIVTGSGCRDATGGATSMDTVFGMLTDGALEVVVATDVGCEGLNLQAAAYVIHSDLPWSPAKLEQRLGRVSRIGQRSSHVDEIVLVAQGSPVAAVLRRKSVDAARFAPRRSGSQAAGGSPRSGERLIAESDEPRCVVDFVERGARHTSHALRALDVDGRAGSAREGRELARELEGAALRASKGRDSPVDAAVDAWMVIVRARDLQPPRLDVASPQHKMLEAAERAGALTRELVESMSRRYRAGTEILIAGVAAGRVDGAAVAALVREIGEEARGCEPYEATVAGSIVTRGWLRAAEGLRGGRRI